MQTVRSSRLRVQRVQAVAVPSKPPTSRLAKRSKVEIIKEQSDYLRHPLMEELVDDKTFINEEAMQLMKFHGSYMQDQREKRAFGQGKFYQFMMRTRQPSGLVTNRLYLVMDDLADKYGNGTLRLTTRQAYQLHGVLKTDLKTVFSTVIKNMGSTLGACGDVNRNVMGPAAPYVNRPEYVLAQQYANDFADLLAPQSGAYYDIWLDGEKFVTQYTENPKVTADRAFNGFGTNFENSPEPIYGTQFLPRKFKIAVTVPGDNSVDIFTNDIGVVVITDAKGELQGFDILVGGGMGRSHRNDDTFPRLADPLGYVDKDDIFHAIKAIVATQRDYGRRDARNQARLKYLVQEWGIDKFRSVTEQYLGKKFEPFKPLPDWKFEDYLGWHEQGDGKLFVGVYVQNGRLKGEPKKVLRAIIESYGIPVTLTANQNIILRDVEPAWKADIQRALTAAGLVDVVDLTAVDRFSMACPALPLCGLAITGKPLPPPSPPSPLQTDRRRRCRRCQAERSLPHVNQRVTALLGRLGLEGEALTLRMTGCPNGCARPYMAEIGFVGDGPNSYQVWLGGSSNQTRLAEVFAERVKLANLEAFLEPLFAYWRASRRPGEGFGDFSARVGFAALREYSAAYVTTSAADALPKVALPSDTYEALAALAAREGKSIAHVANEQLQQLSGAAN